ncbi:DUF4395 domain-containing protein [Microbacterium lushaniae]|uniref:DUF4395 domain-containing protein n=1 Tax=Microbacterium lushaniae TaxID=2614639 RepID=A0A5J6L2G0_9MICO|nr:DUF4395 domain-containing protein [Microbacterium lushaniae]QEW02670.1 DUF4395 domain-containing protein [Microbacterium lushaniae]
MPEERPRGIDPRGPRFTAAGTALLLAVDVVLALAGIATARIDSSTASFGWFAYQPLADATYYPGGVWAIRAASPAERMADPGFLLLAVVALLFLWGMLSPRTAPWGALFRRVVQPRLPASRHLEDPRPPRFAQGVGLLVSAVGLLLHVVGVPWALPVAAAMAFVASFLNAAFGLCVGCRLYLLLQRAGLIGRSRAASV